MEVVRQIGQANYYNPLVVRSKLGKTPKRLQFWNSTNITRGWLTWNSDYSYSLAYGNGNPGEVPPTNDNKPSYSINGSTVYLRPPKNSTYAQGIWKAYVEFE